MDPTTQCKCQPAVKIIEKVKDPSRHSKRISVPKSDNRFHLFRCLPRSLLSRRILCPACRSRYPNSTSSIEGRRYLFSLNPPVAMNTHLRMAPRPVQKVVASGLEI